jgi:hypothetical protein
MRHVWLAALACAIAVPSVGLAQRAPDLRKPAGTPHPSVISQIIVAGPAVAEAPPTVVGPSGQQPQAHGVH